MQRATEPLQCSCPLRHSRNCFGVTPITRTSFLVPLQRLKFPHEVSVPHLRTDTKCPVLNAGGLDEDRIRINEDGCVGLDDGPPCLSSWLGGRGWSRGRDLNPRPADYESAALPLSYPGISSQGWVLTERLSLARVWVL